MAIIDAVRFRLRGLTQLEEIGHQTASSKIQSFTSVQVSFDVLEQHKVILTQQTEGPGVLMRDVEIGGGAQPKRCKFVLKRIT